MNPTIALGLCWIGILWFFRHDHVSRPNCSGALWITVMWIFFLGSHPLPFWLSIHTGSDNLEGNWFDMLYDVVVISISWVILQRRQVNFGALLASNRPLVFFYAFLALTILWAPLPFPTIKRWIKEVGGILVLLIPLTEKDPMEAIEAVFLRCAYVLLPLSEVFIKYVPELGRTYSPGGGLENVGATQQKNSLGEIVMVFGLVIIWSMTIHYNKSGGKGLFRAMRWPIAMLVLGLWLLVQADSKTSMICLIGGAVILVSDKLPILKTRPRLTIAAVLFLLPTYKAIDAVVPLTPTLLHLMGRKEDFTGRAEIWHVIQDYPVNPLIGTGYLMYWDIHKVVLIDGNNVTLRTFHNGYIDMYADGGILGCAVLAIMLLCTGTNAARAFLSGDRFGKLQLAFFSATLFYNLSESAWGRRGPIWCAFLMMCIGPRSIFMPSKTYEEQEEQPEEPAAHPHPV